MGSTILGVLLSSVLLSGSIIYFDSLKELAIRDNINNRTNTDLDIVLRTTTSPITVKEYQSASDKVEQEAISQIGWLHGRILKGGRSESFFLSYPENKENARKGNSRTYFNFVPNLEQNITLVAGGWSPSSVQSFIPKDTIAVEALVSLTASQQFGVEAGDRFTAVHPSDNANPYVEIIVTGVFEESSKYDPEFWHLDSEVLQPHPESPFRNLPFYLPEESFFEILGASYPKMESTYAWLIDVSDEKINARNSEEALLAIRNFNSILNTTLPNYRSDTVLSNILSEYKTRIFFSQIPMFVVLTLIAIVILYYVITLSSMAIENRRAEIVMLRSRGAGTDQILSVFAIEGASIALIVTAIAPLVAAITISLLGITPAFSNLTNGSLTSVSISLNSYYLSGLGGILSFIALIIPAFHASKTGVNEQRYQAARPSRILMFQKYYLDILLLLAGMFLFQQLSEQGSLIADDLLGGPIANNILLSVPAIILLATGMISLRLFPLLMQIISKVLSPTLPAGVALGIWQVTRDPIHYSRLSLLLMLTAGLGIFSSNFGSTLQNSFKERVLYSVGSDIRISNLELQGNSSTYIPESLLLKSFGQIEGVDQLSRVLRAPAQALGTQSAPSIVMLSVDTNSFGDVGWFRKDFSDTSITPLLKSLEVKTPPTGLDIPINTVALEVKIRSDRLQPTIELSARIKNSLEEYIDYPLGNLSSTGWLDLNTNLINKDHEEFLSNPPLSIVSLQIRETFTDKPLSSGSLIIDHIATINSSGNRTILEDFDSISGWQILRATHSASSDKLNKSTSVSNLEPGSAIFSWSPGEPLTPRGIFPGPAISPLPVLASVGFTNSTNYMKDDTLDVSISGIKIPVRIIDVIKFFPTIKTQDDIFLVSDLNSLKKYTNLGGFSNTLPPIELWISTTEESPEINLSKRLSEVPNYRATGIVDRMSMMAKSKVDPLVEAGWEALLFISFSAVLVLSCIGFLLHAYMSYKSREIQFALARTMGFSTKQLNVMIWVEHGFIIIIGMALGTWIGSRLSATVMPFLSHDDRGSRVIPPFTMEYDWITLLITYSIMLLIFTLTLLGLVSIINRITIQKTLRLGDL